MPLTATSPARPARPLAVVVRDQSQRSAVLSCVTQRFNRGSQTLAITLDVSAELPSDLIASRIPKQPARDKGTHTTASGQA